MGESVSGDGSFGVGTLKMAQDGTGNFYDCMSAASAGVCYFTMA